MRPVKNLRWIAACVASGALLASLGAAGLPELSSTILLDRIAQAQRESRRSLTIPAGTYRMPAPGDDAHLVFRNLHDFEIDATGVTLVLSTPDRLGLVFENCRSVTLRGLTVRRENLPYSQGRIVSLSPDRQLLEVRVADGYPTRFTDGSLATPPPFYVFDPSDRQWKARTADIYPRSLEPLGEGLFSLTLGQPLSKEMPVAIGDLLAWRGVGKADIRLEGCESMRLLDVTVAGGSGFCFHEAGGNGNNQYRINVTYPPTPDGAREAPLIASNADAFHSRGVRHGPTLEHCHFEGMPDDGIAIHGSYGLVTAANGPRLTVDAQGGFTARTGDRLRLIDAQGVCRADAIVQSVAGAEPVRDFPQTLWRIFAKGSQQRPVEVVLDQAIPAKAGCLLANADTLGSGFTIRHCTIRRHRARGMLLKADRGLVEDNRIEDSTMGGIVVSPEMGYWNESDYARDLVLRRNTIRRVGIWTQAGNPMAGALTIAAFEAGRYVPLPGGHRHIVVEQNTFEENDGVNVLLTSIQNVQLRDNRFVRPMRSPATRGAKAGIRPGVLIEVRECDNVSIEGNRVIEPGAEFKSELGAPVSPGRQDSVD